MSEQKHTPGPWEFEPGEYGYFCLWNPETRQEVLVTGGRNDGDSPITWMGEEMTDADKALITAAPVMLAALQSARTYIQADLDHLLGSFCTKGADGKPDIATLDDGTVFVHEAQQALEQIDAAVAAATGAAS